MNIIIILLPLLSVPVSKTQILSKSFITLINPNKTTWIAGPNFPPNTPKEDLQGLNGAHDDSELYSNIELKVHNITESIPESFDSRNRWPQCESLNRIRSQGSCGSCWAFGAAEAMTDRLCIASEGKTKFQFSPEDLLACCTDCGDGCGGGYSSRAWEYWVENGVVSGGDHDSKEGCQPYSETAFKNGTTPQCSSSCLNPNYNTSYKEDKRFGASNYRISPDVQQIQFEIMKNGPVQATYAVFDDFYNYKSGVYQHLAGEKSGHHAVKILGWGEDNGTPYWLIANSWGTTWGDLGFFKFLRGDNHCGIEGNILGGQPKV